MNKLPRVADEVPGVACRDVLRDEQAGEDALEVLVGLRSVRRERRSRFFGVGREEAGDRAVEDRAVEVVRGQGPFRQEHRRYRIAVNRYRKYFILFFYLLGDTLENTDFRPNTFAGMLRLEPYSKGNKTLGC